MKYILILIVLFSINSCKYHKEIEDYNYIPNNSLRFIRKNNDTSIIINKDDTYYQLILGSQNTTIDADYIITIKDIKDKLIINDITFKLNDKVEINLNNKNICIYIRAFNKDNYSACDFLYLYNPDKDLYITLNNNLSVMFYNSYTKFNYNFMEHLSLIWIDTSTIEDNYYTTLTIEEENFKVEKTKIRSKTIHKKIKT